MYMKKMFGSVIKNNRTQVTEKGIIELFLEQKREELHEACSRMAEPILDELPTCKSEFDVEQLIKRNLDDVGRIYWQSAMFSRAYAYLKTNLTEETPDVNLQEPFCKAFEAATLTLIESIQEYSDLNDSETDFSTLFDKFCRRLYDEIHRFEISAILHAIKDGSSSKTKKSEKKGLFYRYITSPDAIVKPCERCSDFNGQELPLEDAQEFVNLPCLHENCRCGIEAVDGSRSIPYTFDDLHRMLENIDFNHTESLIIRASVYTDDNGERWVVRGDQRILSPEDYAILVALDELYRAFTLVGDRVRADAVKYQMVLIRQKEAYHGQYQLSDANGVYLDTYEYANKSATEGYYFHIEHLDETKLLKHGGEGTPTQEAIWSAITALIVPPEKTLSSVGLWLGELFVSLLGGTVYKPNLNKWGVSDVLTYLDKAANLIVREFNPGSTLRNGDVNIYMASNPESGTMGTDYFFRGKNLVYFKNEMDKIVRWGIGDDDEREKAFYFSAPSV